MKNLVIVFFCYLFFVGCAAAQAAPQGILVPSTVSYNRDAYSFPFPDVSEELDVDASTPLFTATPENGERVVPLRSTQPAPFNGVLFNSAAVAFVEVQVRNQQTMCLINRAADRQRVAAQAIADIERIQASLRSQEQTANSLITGRDREIQRLQQESGSASVRNVVLSVGIGLAGVGLGILTGFLIGR